MCAYFYFPRGILGEKSETKCVSWAPMKRQPQSNEILFEEPLTHCSECIFLRCHTGVRHANMTHAAPTGTGLYRPVCLVADSDWESERLCLAGMITDVQSLQRVFTSQTWSRGPGGLEASCSPQPLPACRAVSQESLIMKAKIFYSDLLIWKWSVPVGRGTALLNLSSVRRAPVTPPYICLVGSDSRILPGASPPGITRGFFERNKTHSDKEQPLY